MSEQPPIAITGMGMMTPVGLSVAASCSAFRAGITRITPVFGKMLTDAENQPVPATGGRVPLEWFTGGPIEDEYRGHEAWKLPIPPPSHAFVTPGAARLLELAGPAATEAWKQSRADDVAPRTVGLYLGLDELDEARALADGLGDALRLSFTLQRADRLGRAAGLAALHRAVRHMAEGRVEVALVGGVDSLVRPEAIDRLATEGRLKSEDHPQGVAPGEAAAFLVLEAPPRSKALAWITGTGVAEEPTVGTEDANEGVGLTRAIRAARAAAGANQPSHFPRLVCDLNGDRYRAMEWAYALIRALPDLKQDKHSEPWGPEETERWHPAEFIGDTGAASGIVNAVWAATAMRAGYANTRDAFLWGASEGPLRAAAFLTTRNLAGRS
jgi:3-oxoacyl-[acyl-carrier-protein] synthase-1